MDAILDIIIIAGLGSLGALWALIVVMMLHTVWDTVGEHILSIMQKLRDKM